MCSTGKANPVHFNWNNETFSGKKYLKVLNV